MKSGESNNRPYFKNQLYTPNGAFMNPSKTKNLNRSPNDSAEWDPNYFECAGWNKIKRCTSVDQCPSYLNIVNLSSNI